MPGRPSAIGFGFQPFGYYPFGSADWAEEVTWKILPQFYKDADAKLEATPTEPLRKWIDALKPSFQEIVDKYEQFPTLWDANRVPIEQLANLGYNFNIIPSSIKDEALQRSEVLNAIQFFLNKGIDNGYAIAAAFSGFLVTVTPLWADDCGGMYTLGETEPSEFFPRFDGFPLDTVAADTTFTGFWDRWPDRLDWEIPCRSSWLKLYFTSPTDTELEPEEFSVVAEDVINNIERVRPIHVRIFDYRFEGPGAIGGGWTIPVTAENAAVGGGWSISATGSLSAVGGGWSIPVTAVPVS